MRLSLTHKIVGALLLALVICSVVVLSVSIHFMKEPIEEELKNNIQNLQRVVEATNDVTAQTYAKSAMLISKQDNLARAIVANDNQEVMRLAAEAMKQSGSDFMTVTDEKGRVVGRGHSDKWNDSVLNQETVVKALKGTPAAAMVAGTVVPFTIRASQPVMLDGKLVGTLSIGTSLVAPPYLDWLKKITGMDITFFKGNNRVMTTIMDNGKRLINTKLDNPEIESSVLRDGNSIVAKNIIKGIPYQAAYWPVRTADGTVAGMWFVGAPIAVLEQLESSAIMKTIMVTVGLVVICLIISLIFGLKLSAPVRKITRYVMAVAGGDTQAKLDVYGNDDMGELATALRNMVESEEKLKRENLEKAEAAKKQAEEAQHLADAAKTAHEQAVLAKRDGMITAAAQIESVVQSLNEAINHVAQQVDHSDAALRQTAGNLAGISAAMEEMNSTVLEVAKNVGLAANISAAARDRAADGANVVTQSVNGIQAVHNQSMALKKDMAQLDEHAKSIDKIMGVISDIADQTNLLALNAAIEAARAGEAGRGFAVVADEVRKLAEKTMASTTEVGSAIQSIQHSTEQSGYQVERAVEHIAQANEYSNQSGALLQDILQMVEQTADEVRAIATASEEQASTSEEITRNLNEVNDTTESTSQAMQLAAHGLEALRQRSQDLVNLVERMKNTQ